MRWLLSGSKQVLMKERRSDTILLCKKMEVVGREMFERSKEFHSGSRNLKKLSSGPFVSPKSSRKVDFSTSSRIYGVYMLAARGAVYVGGSEGWYRILCDLRCLRLLYRIRKLWSSQRGSPDSQAVSVTLTRKELTAKEVCTSLNCLYADWQYIHFYFC